MERKSTKSTILLTLLILFQIGHFRMIKDSVNESEEFFSHHLKPFLNPRVSDSELLTLYQKTYNEISLNPKEFADYVEALEFLMSGDILKFSPVENQDIQARLWILAKTTVSNLLAQKLTQKEATEIFVASMEECVRLTRLDLLSQIKSHQGARFFTFFFKNRASQLHKLIMSMFDEQYSIFEMDYAYYDMITELAAIFIKQRSVLCIELFNSLSNDFMMLASPHIAAKALMYRLVKFAERDSLANTVHFEFYQRRFDVALKLMTELRLDQKLLEKQNQDLVELAAHVLDDLKTLKLHPEKSARSDKIIQEVEDPSRFLGTISGKLAQVVNWINGKERIMVF